MPVFTMFDSLPSSLICTVLRDWLNLKSVIALNSAYCQKSRREKFISLLRSSEYFIRENIVFGEFSIISEDALLAFGDKIRCLTFDDSRYKVHGSLVVKHCHNLTHLHYKSIFSCIEVSNMLPNTSRLECVTLSTPCMYYSCPPSQFLSIADLESSEFRRFAQGYSISEEDKVIALQKSAYATRLDFWGDAVSHFLLLQIPQLCPHLTHLGLGKTDLNDEVLRELVISCHNIEHLEIAENKKVTDIGVLAVVQNLKRLKSLNIMGLPKLTSTSLQNIWVHSARTLHTLHMSEFNTVRRDEGSEDEVVEGEEEEDCEETSHDASAVNNLLEHCTQLRVFYYRYRKNFVFTPTAVCNLTTLVLDGGVVCKQNLAIISQYGVHLHTLLVGEITTYSRGSLLALVQGCPRLRRFYYELEAIDMHNIDDYDSNTRQFALAFMDLWMKLKPGLVAEQSLVNRFSYKIMDM